MKKAKKGFALLFIMLMIGGLTLIVVSVSNLVFTSKGVLTVIDRNIEKYRALQSSVDYITWFLNQTEKENEKSKEAPSGNLQNQQNQQGPQNSQNPQKKDEFEKSKKHALYLIEKINYEHQKKLTYQDHGIDAIIQFTFFAEDGKIPLKNYLHLLRKEETEKEDDKKNNSNIASGNQPQQVNNISDEEKETEDKKEENYFKSEVGKKIEKIFSFLEEKSTILPDSNSTSGDKKISLKGLFENYLKKKDPVITDSLACLYQKPFKELYAYDKHDQVGDLLSVYNNLLNLMYISPAFISLISSDAKNKNLNADSGKKLKENLKKILENTKQNFTMESALESLYKDIYKIDKIKDLDEGIKSDIELSLLPTYLLIKLKLIVEKESEHYLIFYQKVDRENIIQFYPFQIFSL
jgi:hypothetical protein